MKAKIKRAVKELGKEKQETFTLKELEKIARISETKVLDVMYYLRYQR